MPPTTLDQSDQPPEPPRAIVTLPSRDQQTSLQVGTLLQAAGMLSQLLNADFDGHGIHDISPALSEASVAAENTIVKICARLDSILDDVDRWNSKSQCTLEEDLSKVYRTHIELMEEQKAAVRLIKAPHRLAGVKLCRLVESGQWAAVLGDPKTDNFIIGVGETPSAALENFDIEFEKPTTTNEQPKSEPSLDTRTHSDPPKPKKRRSHLGPHKPPPGSDGKCGSAEI